MDAIKENILGPLVRRIGTAAAVWLIAEGWDSAAVDALVNWLSAGVLLLCDLLLARFYRRAVTVKAVAEAVNAFGGTARLSRLATEGD